MASNLLTRDTVLYNEFILVGLDLRISMVDFNSANLTKLIIPTWNYF
jgi:hypothetical protein